VRRKAGDSFSGIQRCTGVALDNARIGGKYAYRLGTGEPGAHSAEFLRQYSEGIR
jgi:hypothetical protein